MTKKEEHTHSGKSTLKLSLTFKHSQKSRKYRPVVIF